MSTKFGAKTFTLNRRLMLYVHLSEVYFQRNVEAKTLKIAGKLMKFGLKFCHYNLNI